MVTKEGNLTAQEMAKEMRSVSVSEFFERNRHLLGYDNPTKALLTVIKEGVDNSLDASEESGILPEIKVDIKQLEETRFKIVIEDNGPGIIKEKIPNVFASLLYGSKFHRLRQSRGVQGIGISSAVLYSQLTTGKSAKITSKVHGKKKAHYYELHINTKNNEPEIVKDEEIELNKDHGVKIELEIEAKFQKGKQSVDEYIKQTAIVNPHAAIYYTNANNEKFKYERAVQKLPLQPKQIKPHPYGVELGALMRMLRETKARTIQSFLTTEFSRVSNELAKKICEASNIYINSKPADIAAKEAESLYKATQSIKIMAPPTNCLSPIGEESLIKGLQKEVKADFYAATSRPPNVYRGFPFQIEVGIAYGGELPQEEFARLMRFANRVPLLYQQSACAITRAVINTAWKNYSISQSKRALPTGPLVVMVHIASVWVPFTSEAKEAAASYPEILKEIKLALQDCGRKLGSYIRKTVRAHEQKEKVGLFEKYIPELANALNILTGENKTKLIDELNKKLKKELPLILAGNSQEPEIKIKSKPKNKKEEQTKLG